MKSFFHGCKVRVYQKQHVYRRPLGSEELQSLLVVNNTQLVTSSRSCRGKKWTDWPLQTRRYLHPCLFATVLTLLSTQSASSSACVDCHIVVASFEKTIDTNTWKQNVLSRNPTTASFGCSLTFFLLLCAALPQRFVKAYIATFLSIKTDTLYIKHPSEASV